jgi:hypothetical protein
MIEYNCKQNHEYKATGKTQKEVNMEIAPEESFKVMKDLLYNLSQEELRRIAWECLLIADGPDKVVGELDMGLESDFHVRYEYYKSNNVARFVLDGKKGWTT